MNDNRKLCLCLISVLGILMTAMTFLYRQSSPFWIASQSFLLLGTVIFLGMALFVCDARSFKLFALPGGMIVLGELFSVCSQFRFQLGTNGMQMEYLAEGGQPIELLSAILSVMQFIVLAWAVIDISTDFSFCDMTCLALAVCCGFTIAVDLTIFSFGIQEGIEQMRMNMVTCLSDILAFGTVVVFYFTYTKERRMMKRYYKTLAAEQRKAEQQVKVSAEKE